MTIRGNDYWDLTERERAALTRDEVQAYLSFELMQKGVLEPEPLKLATVPAVKLATAPVYRIRTSDGFTSSSGLAFATEEAARAALAASPMLITREYIGDSVDCTVSTALAIECVELPTKESVDAARVTLKEAASVKADNERRSREHTEAMKKVESAVKGLWEDWHDCRETAERIAKVDTTFAKYTTLAGGATELAKKFLRQVFTIVELKEAETWTGKNYGTVVDAEYEEVGVPAEENHVVTGTQAF